MSKTNKNAISREETISIIRKVSDEVIANVINAFVEKKKNEILKTLKKSKGFSKKERKTTTQQIVNTLQYLSEDDLVKIKKQMDICFGVFILCRWLRKGIAEDGFAVGYDKCDLGSGYDYLTAPYYVQLEARGKYYRDARIIEHFEPQAPWVRKLGIGLGITGDENFEAMDEWEPCHRDNRAVGKGKITMFVYFKTKDKKKYEAIVNGE